MQIENDIVTDYFVLTAANACDPGTQETHYQTFIIDKTIQHILCIDSSRNSRGESYYEPYVAKAIIGYFRKSNYNYKCTYLKITNALQTSSDDVFCQSWSLYLLIKALENLNVNKDNYITAQIETPEDELIKYEILLDFYKNIFNEDKLFQTDLQKLFKTYLNITKERITDTANDILMNFTVDNMLV